MPRASNTRRERIETFPVAKSFNKFVELPHVIDWKVNDSDVLASGRVLSYIRSKGLIFDSVSRLKERMLTVTKQGFLVVYEKRDQGLVIDARASTHVITKQDTFKNHKKQFERCHIKMKFARGNLHLFLRGTAIAYWRDALFAAHESRDDRMPTPIISTALEATEMSVRDSASVIESEFGLYEDQQSSKPISLSQENSADILTTSSPSSDTNSEVEDEATSLSEAVPPSSVTTSNSGMITEIERPAPVELQSVRRGNNSVSALRRRIERVIGHPPNTPTRRAPSTVLNNTPMKSTNICEDVVNEDDETSFSVKCEKTHNVCVSSLIYELPRVPSNRSLASTSQSSTTSAKPTTTEPQSATSTPKPAKRTLTPSEKKVDPEWWMRSLRC